MTRVCNKCHVEKPLDEFHTHRRLKLGKAYTCKSCVGALVRAWAKTPRGRERQKIAKAKHARTERSRSTRLKYQRRPDVKARDAVRDKVYRQSVAGRYTAFAQLLRRSYGIGVEDWAHMFNTQGGKCGACARSLAFDRTTHVDHEHATGKVRGLLCQGCNVAIGGARDNPEVLRRLAVYLEVTS